MNFRYKSISRTNYGLYFYPPSGETVLEYREADRVIRITKGDKVEVVIRDIELKKITTEDVQFKGRECYLFYKTVEKDNKKDNIIFDNGDITYSPDTKSLYAGGTIIQMRPLRNSMPQLVKGQKQIFDQSQTLFFKIL